MPSPALVPPLGDGVRDAPAAQHPAAGRVAVALVGNEVIGSLPQPPSPPQARHADGVEDRLQLSAVVALPRREHDRERPPLPIASQVQHGSPAATAASKTLVQRPLDTLLAVSGAWLPPCPSCMHPKPPPNWRFWVTFYVLRAGIIRYVTARQSTA
jgi:hypothetical protein